MPLALLSVFDKSGVVELAKGLRHLGWDLMSSGGTAKVLQDAGLSVLEVAEYTGSPEILSGRVKTLHPAIAGGLLARDREEDYMELEKINAKKIDLVACNLYPFGSIIKGENTSLNDAIENIDIGGVTLLRAAAKNYEFVLVVSDPVDYGTILQLINEGMPNQEYRRKLAEKAFVMTADYDAQIAEYLKDGYKSLQLHRIQSLRYGENWHQKAELFGFHPDQGPLGGELLQGKTLSYNNVLDVDAAWRAVNAYERPTVCIVKHLSPCGIASADNLSEAYPNALASDPVSAYGSVIAVNREFDINIAQNLEDLFVECIAAPGFTTNALEILSKKKNLRLLNMKGNPLLPAKEYRSVVNGMLSQTLDIGDPHDVQWRVVTKRQPTEKEWESLRFGWTACQHVKSNAIVFAKGEATVGIGGGQPNRVDCVKIAGDRAGEKTKGAGMASDAFFPFPDGIQEAVKLGITAVIQPGGSIRDELSIEFCNQLGISMVFTGARHFRH